MGTPHLRIGELADRAGVNPKTIRYYEEIGVLPEPPRTPAGHRVFSDDDVERLRFVRTAQRLGFRLDEIREILAYRDRDELPCGFVRHALARKVAELDARIEEMRRLRDQLDHLAREAADTRGDPAFCCAVIEVAGSHPG